nr:hypothetical protein [Chloroflexota bacterium]
AEQRTAMERFFSETPQTPGAEECGMPNRVLVARFDEMTTKFALVTWNRGLLLDEFDIDTAITFAEQNMDQTNPERVC